MIKVILIFSILISPGTTECLLLNNRSALTLDDIINGFRKHSKSEKIVRISGLNHHELGQQRHQQFDA
jgi:hypothetical protein